MKKIDLGQEKFALVDNIDYDKVVNYPYKWRAFSKNNIWYARAYMSKNSCIRMHRFILNAKAGEQIDHIDGNGLNNCRDNLRFVNNSQQHMNQRKTKNSLSLYKGVDYYKTKKKWRAKIMKNYHSNHLGYFDTEEEAALAYNTAAKVLFGEYAKLNEIWR